MGRRPVLEANTYQGGPCKNCGGTLRYRKGHQCIPCTKANARMHSRRERAARNVTGPGVSPGEACVLCDCGTPIANGSGYRSTVKGAASRSAPAMFCSQVCRERCIQAVLNGLRIESDRDRQHEIIERRRLAWREVATDRPMPESSRTFEPVFGYV